MGQKQKTEKEKRKKKERAKVGDNNGQAVWAKKYVPELLDNQFNNNESKEFNKEHNIVNIGFRIFQKTYRYLDICLSLN